MNANNIQMDRVALLLLIWTVIGWFFCSGADSKKISSVPLDTEMPDDCWISYQGPEVNEVLASYDGKEECRHVVDSIPSFGGIINAEDFRLKKGRGIMQSLLLLKWSRAR